MQESLFLFTLASLLNGVATSSAFQGLHQKTVSSPVLEKGDKKIDPKTEYTPASFLIPAESSYPPVSSYKPASSWAADDGGWRVSGSEIHRSRPAKALFRPVKGLLRFAGRAFTSGRRQAGAADDYPTSKVGEPGKASYRLKFSDKFGHGISPWHDIPLSAGDGTFNAVFEIPKMTKPKMEVATKETGNPIAQDEKNGKLRDYHGPIFWNYGMFPQTWEDPSVQNSRTKCNGDNDPLDVVEIGSKVQPTGTVTPVKPLGALAMIDEGELDWKIIAISTEDPLAQTLNDITDVPISTVNGIREWFRWYKTPDGKQPNKFGFDEKALNRAQTLAVIAETHEAWKRLMCGDTEPGKLWVKCGAPACKMTLKCYEDQQSPELMAAPIRDLGSAKSAGRLQKAPATERDNEFDDQQPPGLLFPFGRMRWGLTSGLAGELVARTSVDVISLPIVALIGVFVGSGLAFALLRFPRRKSRLLLG